MNDNDTVETQEGPEGWLTPGDLEAARQELREEEVERAREWERARLEVRVAKRAFAKELREGHTYSELFNAGATLLVALNTLHRLEGVCVATGIPSHPRDLEDATAGGPDAQ